MCNLDLNRAEYIWDVLKNWWGLIPNQFTMHILERTLEILEQNNCSIEHINIVKWAIEEILGKDKNFEHYQNIWKKFWKSTFNEFIYA